MRQVVAHHWIIPVGISRRIIRIIRLQLLVKLRIKLSSISWPVLRLRLVLSRLLKGIQRLISGVVLRKSIGALKIYISLKDNKTRLVVDRDKPKFSYGLGMTGGYQLNQSLPLRCEKKKISLPEVLKNGF